MIKTIAAAALAVATAAAAAPARPPRPATGDAAALNAEVLRTRRVGPAVVRVGRHAVLDLPAGRMFVPRPAATRILAAMGQAVDGRLIGLVYPMDGATGWVVVASSPPPASCTKDTLACVRLSMVSEAPAATAGSAEVDDLLARLTSDAVRPETGVQAPVDDGSDADDSLAALAASVDSGRLGWLALAGLGSALPMLFRRRAEAGAPAG